MPSGPSLRTTDGLHPEQRHREAKRARIATLGVFALCGVARSLWSASLPGVDERLQLSAHQLGLALLVVGIGSIVAMPAAGRLSDRWTSRRLLRISGPLAALTVVGPALAPGFGLLLVTAFLLGAGLGVLDVAMNAQAIEVEQRFGRPILSSFHGLWSLGGVAGSGVIALGLHLHGSGQALVACGALVVAALSLLPGRALLRPERTAAETPAGGPSPAAEAERTAEATEPVPLRAGLILLLGLTAMAAFLSEGAGYDWAALHARQELGADSATAPLAYTAFAAALTVTRLTSDGLRRRLGPVRGIAWAGAISVLGYALVLLAPHLSTGRLGFAFVGWAVAGAGLATVVPAVFSSLAANEGSVGRGLAWVSTLAYGGNLAGPAVIGLIAGATSLGSAMLLPMAMALTVVLLGPIALRATLAPPPARRLQPVNPRRPIR
ncbi:MFS transporter [Streptomyces sp. NPDC050161]|uniref:MFS transporter n=1 Tax=Streptomyces sp. NPDC050161 TaxID=3365604 RepID=UPI0037911F6A